jgi:thiol-disulfide isomerase/thioredoxin
MPDFQHAYEAFPDGLVVLAVNYFENSATATRFLDEKVGVTFPSVLDSTGSVADHYRVGRGLPTTFFIDADGVLVDFQIGEVRTDDLKRHLAALGFDWTPSP